MLNHGTNPLLTQNAEQFCGRVMRVLESLATAWLKAGETLTAYGDERGARICRLHASQLRAALREVDREVVDMQEAAQVSGYSERRLRELVAEGRLANIGEKGRPRFLRADLPVKPSGSYAADYEVASDAHRIAELSALRR